jgi:heme-degrading monooxygenase HmoA
MFIHAVLFEMDPKEVLAYRRDSKMWAGFARRAKGFLAYFTMRRHGYKRQYVSVYEWKTESGHNRFMKKYHKRLVVKSKAKVKVLGHYNLQAIDRLRP